MVAAPPSRTPGKYEQLCWDRHHRDLDLTYPAGTPDSLDPELWRSASRHPKGLWFDPTAGERPIEWIEGLCKHHKGEWAGQPLILEEGWQRPIFRVAFGWKRADATRRFRIIYVEVPRKNGKSETAAGLGLYLLEGDGEAGAEIYASATKKEQAKIVWDTARAMVNASPELKDLVTVRRNVLSDPETLSKFEPLGADSERLDGLNPHGNIVDELHAHKTRGLWDVLDTAMGARRQPLTLAITTAGTYEPESIGWLQHEHAIKVLEGTIEDDGFFGFIAAADPDDDWQSPATWAKANPNLGVSVKLSYLEDQCRKAQNQPSFLNTFLRLHLNRWTQQQDRWIAIEAWNDCELDIGRPAMVERETSLVGEVCFAALDLSTKLDITALVLLFPPAPGRDAYILIPRFWVPELRIEQRVRRDRVPYDAWVRDGWLLATPGDVIDYDAIRLEVLDLSHKYQIRDLGFDPWNATQIATQLTGDGLLLTEVRQGYATLSEPSKEFEKLVISKQIRHGGHPVLRWMVANVAKHEDPAGNIKPDKSASSDKIDGVVAAIMALSRAIVQVDGRSVYEEEGLLTL